MNKPLIMIESPYSGNTATNMQYLHRCIRHSISKGEAPFASHLMYTQALNDGDPIERLVGLDCGYSWLEQASAQVFYVDLGWSPGMLEAWRMGKAMEIPWDIRWIDHEENPQREMHEKLTPMRLFKYMGGL